MTVSGFFLSNKDIDFRSYFLETNGSPTYSYNEDIKTNDDPLEKFSEFEFEFFPTVALEEKTMYTPMYTLNLAINEFLPEAWRISDIETAEIHPTTGYFTVGESFEDIIISVYMAENTRDSLKNNSHTYVDIGSDLQVKYTDSYGDLYWAVFHVAGFYKTSGRISDDISGFPLVTSLENFEILFNRIGFASKGKEYTSFVNEFNVFGYRYATDDMPNLWDISVPVYQYLSPSHIDLEFYPWEETDLPKDEFVVRYIGKFPEHKGEIMVSDSFFLWLSGYEDYYKYFDYTFIGGHNNPDQILIEKQLFEEWKTHIQTFYPRGFLIPLEHHHFLI